MLARLAGPESPRADPRPVPFAPHLVPGPAPAAQLPRGADWRLAVRTLP